MRIGIEVFGTQTWSRHRGIGRYSRNLAATILDRDPDNDYILYGQEGLPTDLIPTAPNAVVRLLRPDPGRGEATLADATQRMAETNPDGLDVLLLLNPLEMTPGYDLPARPLGGLKVVALVYDLIPLLFQDECLPGAEVLRRYLQGLNRLRSYDALLAISEATRQDFLSLLGLHPDRVTTIGTASDGRFFVPDATETIPDDLRALGIARPFVFSVGAMDFRKNMWGLIEAFAMLPPDLRRGHQLVLTFRLSEPDKDRLRQHARDRGVDDHLVLTGQVPDESLRVLYQRCAAFVFPSLYEGFGLPILEAMHCGAPVIAGNNSSQVEVVGDAGLLFNAADSGELAGHLTRLLGQPDLAADLRRRAVVQARRFSWVETADKALEVLAGPLAPRASAAPRPARRRAPRRRIAFFSPLTPLRSGIAVYSARLLDELRRRYAIDLYHDARYLPHVALSDPDFGCYDSRLFDRNAKALGYHAAVYQMGNSEYHGYMYQALLRHPGVVTLHDFGLAGFHHWYARQPGVDGDAHLRAEFAASFGAAGDEVLRSLADADDGAEGKVRACAERGYHLNARVLDRAEAVIVHSPWALERVRGRSPALAAKVAVVPHGATALGPAPARRGALRARLELPPRALVVACLGMLHPNKLNAETIAAFAPLAAADPEALLVFAGEEIDYGAARAKAAELGLRHRVRFLGHYPGDLAELAAAADIGVCLRRPPTNGETSGALLDLLRAGVATIVSDVGTFSGYPDAVVRKHRMEADGVPGLARALLELAEDRAGREALGRAAREHIEREHSWSGAAEAYEEVIERAAAARARPRAEGSWTPPGPRAVAPSAWLQAAS